MIASSFLLIFFLFEQLHRKRNDDSLNSGMLPRDYIFSCAYRLMMLEQYPYKKKNVVLFANSFNVQHQR